jgi:TRAP-type C4-dicarboxylate transport system substrate-binding protein
MKGCVGLPWACALAATLVSGVAAAETVKLTVVGAAPAPVTYVKATKERFIPEFNKRLAASGKDFKIEWTEAYAQSLANFNETLEAVEDGIAHVGLILKNFEESKLPLEQYMYMVPFLTHSTQQMIAVDAALHKKVPEMPAQYEKHNQIFLISGGNASMELFTTFPVKTVDDLKGRKIGASGAMGHWLRGTGAVTVTASMLQSFTDIKNGVYDGYPISITLAFPYKTYEAAPHMTVVGFGPSATSTITVHKPTWAKLPQHVRDIFMDLAQQWPQWQLEIDEANEARFRDMMLKKGMKIADMAPAERARWAKQMPNIAQEWANAMEKDGHPGKKVLKAYMDEVRALNVEIARHWDRE